VVAVNSWRRRYKTIVVGFAELREDAILGDRMRAAAATDIALTQLILIVLSTSNLL
jgi:hypothetical protein